MSVDCPQFEDHQGDLKSKKRKGRRAAIGSRGTLSNDSIHTECDPSRDLPVKEVSKKRHTL